LPGHAGEIRDADVDFVRGKRAEEFRDARNFGATAGVLADILRAVDEGGEEHERGQVNISEILTDAFA